MKSMMLAAVSMLALSACTTNADISVADSPAPVAQATATAQGDTTPNYGTWGVDMSRFDTSIKPGTDFDQYVNGGWRDATVIPDDQIVAGVGWDVYTRSEAQVRDIITDAPASSNIGALYQSFMDEPGLEAKGAAPLLTRIAAMDAIPDKAGFTSFMGATARKLGSTLISTQVIPDFSNPTVNTLVISTNGMGLPQRDYYLDPKFAEQLAAYTAFVTRSFGLIGSSDAAADAKEVLAFETKVAELSWPVAEQRDINKINNPMTMAQLQAYAPGIDYPALFAAAGIPTDQKMIVADNTAVKSLAALYAKTPLATLKKWEKLRMTVGASNYLSKAFVDSQFELSQQMSGAKVLRDRWKRGVALVSGSLGELVGQTYVERHFPASSKAAMEDMVANLKVAMGKRITANSWMSPPTKAEALEKLSRMDVMVGYPDDWRDYSVLKLSSNDLLGNVIQVGAFNWDYQLAKLNEPVDRKLWAMNPQTVNAYNGGLENKIVFPAAILQAPYFNPKADAAVNYGAIGAVIGHEISHGFDDQGRKIDASGAVRNWWTEEDGKRFEALAKEFGAQYAEYEVAPGHFINPELTMGENIADLAGSAGRARCLSRLAQRQGRAVDRRPDRRPALFPGLRSGVADQGTRAGDDPAGRVGPAQLGALSRARSDAQPRRLVRRVQRRSGFAVLYQTGRPRAHLVARAFPRESMVSPPAARPSPQSPFNPASARRAYCRLQRNLLCRRQGARFCACGGFTKIGDEHDEDDTLAGRGCRRAGGIGLHDDGRHRRLRRCRGRRDDDDIDRLDDPGAQGHRRLRASQHAALRSAAVRQDQRCRLRPGVRAGHGDQPRRNPEHRQQPGSADVRQHDRRNGEIGPDARARGADLL